MSDFALQRVSRELFTIPEVGSLAELSGYGSEIEADAIRWRVARAAGGLGRRIDARRQADSGRGAVVCRYTPRGLLGWHGIATGTISYAGRRLDWRRQPDSDQFVLADGPQLLAVFSAGTERSPSSAPPTEAGRRIGRCCCSAATSSNRHSTPTPFR
jgi:hypothetical protein